jgi:hypothetical protein
MCVADGWLWRASQTLATQGLSLGLVEPTRGRA